ncbi:anti-sigma factor [Sanyastnella coralliicola]|uniref:anti-sigma factor n=1 Tax=Sanyastnella coralliicola TaxID=3069118 RepID=UPI0027B992A3|nr:anti-sigma factor [Longitalea sp. SCSIO 12813]
MDVKAYISSGILEHYVLGTVSLQEQQEVECMSHIYPEIAAELVRLQESIERYAESLGTPPPSRLEVKIMEAIKDEQQLPAENTNTKEHEAVIHLNTQPNVKPIRFAAIAAAVAALVFGGFWLNENKQRARVTSELNHLKQEQQNLVDQQDQLEAKLVAQATEIDLQERIKSNLIDSFTKTVLLAGTANSPESSVNIYWNRRNAEVMMKVEQLPMPETDKQYQLWAIVDGEPQDMGVFDIDLNSNDILLIPVAIAEAQAFAITLETKGGNPVPNLDALYVIGNVNA